MTYNKLTDKDHLWIMATAWIYIPTDNNESVHPVIVATFNHREKPYEFITSDPSFVPEKGKWVQIHLKYLSPEIRNKRKDNLKVFVWYTGKGPVYVDDFKIDKYEPR